MLMSDLNSILMLTGMKLHTRLYRILEPRLSCACRPSCKELGFCCALQSAAQQVGSQRRNREARWAERTNGTSRGIRT